MELRSLNFLIDGELGGRLRNLWGDDRGDDDVSNLLLGDLLLRNLGLLLRLLLRHVWLSHRHNIRIVLIIHR